MIHVDLSTTTGTQTQRVQKEVRDAVVFEATVPEHHHVRVSVDKNGDMTIAHAEWMTIGDVAQWVVQNYIAPAGPRAAAVRVPKGDRNACESLAG